ncbi:MAG: FAD-dependent thymidylate synthase [bacterium]
MVKILKQAGFHEIISIMQGIHGENPLQVIEMAGRTAYQSQDKITEDSAAKFIKMIIKRGHFSVLEHSGLTVRFNDCSRGFTHELVRHRLMAITQESTRYVDESDFLVVIPPYEYTDQSKVKLNLSGGGGNIEVSFQDWMELNEQMYRGLRASGWPTEDARQVLPIGIKSQIVITTNFREWRHIFRMRCGKPAHWEIRRVMCNLLKEVQKLIPIVFDDFVLYEQDDIFQIPKSKETISYAVTEIPE